MTTDSSGHTVSTFQLLHGRIEEAMGRLHVPGVALGIIVNGREHIAGFGVTNVERPSPVREDTLFQVGSTTKTFTATAVMRMVEAGTIDLDMPVRMYLPELRLSDAAATAGVTMRHLLTHTAGWVGDYFADTGRGEDALAKIVASMANLPQLTPLGAVWSYNNAAFYVAGRVVEVVSGKPYEQAIRELVLDPLGMTRCFYFPEEVMIHSFAVGHNVVEDRAVVATPWAISRSSHPAGGLTSTAGDQLRFAQFHMGDGTAEDGTRVLSPETMKLMQTPVTTARIGEQIGLSWFLRNVGGLRIVSHGGVNNGQIAAFMFVPERRFALTILTNASSGDQLNNEITAWALQEYLGISESEPEHQHRTEAEIIPYVGSYSMSLATVHLSIQDGEPLLTFSMSGEFPADTPPPAPPPSRLGFIAADRVICLDEPMKGTKGEFLRDEDGTIVWLRMSGRLFRREG